MGLFDLIEIDDGDVLVATKVDFPDVHDGTVTQR
jgi:hypothetical protein